MRYFFGIIVLVFCCEAKHIPEDGIYSVTEKMPEYEAGMKAFAKHIDSFLAENPYDEQGKVFVKFIVKTDGQLQELRVVKSVCEKNDSLALQAIQTAPLRWNPGIDDGQSVDVEMVYAIDF